MSLDVGTPTPFDAVNLGGGKAQARTDFVGHDLDLGSVLALVGLPTAVLQATRHDHPHALGQAQSHVLGQVTPADDVLWISKLHMPRSACR